MHSGSDAGGTGRYIFSLVLAILIWSTSFVGTKLAFESFPPLTLGACRFIIAAVIVGAVMLLTRQWVRPAGRDAALMALSGFLGITLYFSMENLGVKMTSASNAALIVASYPAITMLLERILYGTALSGISCLGVGMSMAGVYLIIGQGASAAGSQTLLGNVILALTGIVWAFYNFTARKVVSRYPALTVSFVQTAAGTLAFLPLALLEAEEWRVPSPSGMLVLLYLGVLCSVAAFLLYNYGLRRVSSGMAVTFLNLVPVFGVLFSVVVLHEEVRAVQLLGGAVVIAGVVLSAKYMTPASGTGAQKGGKA